MTTAYIALSKKAVNIEGQRFGCLVALGPVEIHAKGGVRWLCRCDCGNTCVAEASKLRGGSPRSCGCLPRESRAGKLPKEGDPKSLRPLYGTWDAMVRRCHRPESAQYKGYGARGIEVYSPWRDSFEEFEFYVAQLPHFGETGRTLDRIDNDGNYEPGNVRWATEVEQKRNTRVNRLFTVNGRTQCLNAWAEESGQHTASIYRRLKNGWSLEDALTKPPADHCRMIAHEGRVQSLADWAKELGITSGAILYRLKQGWSIEKALNTPRRGAKSEEPNDIESTTTQGDN